MFQKAIFKYLDVTPNVTMKINKTILIIVYALVALYLLYKLLFRKDPYQEEYERLYNKILTSDKHKVKGQYDKEE